MDSNELYFGIKIPPTDASSHMDYYDGFDTLVFGTERYFRNLQQMQPEQIERNRRLMKAGKIEFDEYEEVL